MIIQNAGITQRQPIDDQEEKKQPATLDLATSQPAQLQQPQDKVGRPALRDAVMGQVAGGINDPAMMADERLPVSEKQWNLISRAASESNNPDQYMAQYAAALTFSKEYGIPVDTALENLDELTQTLTGKPYQPNRSGVQAIVNSFKAGRLNMQFSDLAYQFKQADLKGEDTTEMLSQLDQYAQAIEGLQDHQPRGVLTTMLKWTAEGAVPYMIEVGQSALTGATFAGALGMGFQAATGVAIGSIAAATPWTMAAIIGWGASVGAINRTRELMEGSSYLKLRESGIDKDIANVGSRAYGMIVGAIERLLGIELGTVLNAVGKVLGAEQAVSTIASKATAKLITSGKLGAFLNGVAALGVNATNEAIEEMSEEVAEYLIRHIAYAWQETRGQIDPMPDENILQDTLQAGLMGFASAIVLGTGSSLFNAGITINQQSAMRNDARRTPSKEVFVNAMEQARPESIEAADWNNTMANLWDREHKGVPESSAIKSDQSAFNELDTGKGALPRGEVRRLSDGRLYATESENITVDTTGAEHRRILYGDPATGSRYGYIDYAIHDNNLVIEDVLVRSGYENIRQEAVVDLIRKFPGYEVQWEAKGEALADVRQAIIESNPRGKDAGLQYWDGLTDPSDRIMVERQIADSMPNLTAPERSVAATLIQLRAETDGLSTQAWLNEHFKDGQLFGDTEVMGDAMQGKRGAVQFGNDLKAVIYAGEHADFSTFAHETFHVILRQMGQIDQLRQAILDASTTPEFMTWLNEHAALFADGIFEGKNAQDLADIAATFGEQQWTRNHEEFAARLYEGYLADGKTTSSRLQQVFEQIAKWMKQIYTTLSNTVDLDPRIVEVFDSLLDKDSPLAAQQRAESTIDTPGTLNQYEKSGWGQGWDHEQNMSVNAVYAYDRGIMPKHKWTKAVLSTIWNDLAGITLPGLTVSELRDSLLRYNEWHHTGKDYRQTDFYQFSLNAARALIAGERGHVHQLEAAASKAYNPYTPMVVNLIHMEGLTRQEAIDRLFSNNPQALIKEVSDLDVDYYNFGRGNDTSWMDSSTVMSQESFVEQAWNYPTTLFQDDFDITESILEEAKGFESWQEFMDYYEAMAFGDEQIPTDVEWYVEVYNRANGINEESAQLAAEQAKAALQSEEAKDEYMRQQLSTDNGVNAFMTKLGWMLSNRALYEVGDDQAAVDAIHEIRQTASDLVHPTIMSNALRRMAGRQLSQRAIKSIRTLMTGDAIRYYRDIYATVMEDFELRPEVIDSRLPGINDPGHNTLDRMSITERLKLANRIEATELKKRLLSGKETYDGAAELIVKDLDLQIQELNDQIKTQEEQLTEIKDRLSDRQRMLVDLSVERENTRRQLDRQLEKVRKLTDEKRQIPKKEMASTYGIQKKLEMLDRQIMQMRESERAKATVKRQDALTAQRQKLQDKARADRLAATVKRHEALAALKEQLTEKQKARAEAQQVREYKLKLARRIMAKPSDAINYEQAQMIYSVQAALDPAYRRESVFLDGVDGDNVRMTIDEAREFFAGSSEDDIVNAIGRRMYEWLAEERKPLNDWTINELEALAEKVGDLRAEGRRVLAAQRERQQAIARQYQELIMQSLIATGKYKSRPLVGTLQEKQDKSGPKHTARSLRYATLPMRAKAMMLDGDTQGAAYDLLITQKRKAQNVEWLAVELRQKPVIEFMKSIGLTEKDLYKTEGIALDLNTSASYTYSAMMYAYLSQFDQDNRNAVAYGNLVTQDEKATLNHDNALIMALGDQRYESLIQQVEYHLSQDDGKYMQVLEQLRRDFNSQKDRLNEVAIREFNKPLRSVEEYLPIHRREFNGEDMHQQIADDLFNQNAGGLPTGVTKGFLQQRIKISPDHQRPINMDLFQVWNNSVRQQEHFIAFAEYGRKLNRVFKNRGSEDMQNVIGRTLGREMMKDIHDYMNEVINPRREVDLAGAQKAVRFMRGNLGAAYLTWKMSSIVLQAITSPAPFLQEVKPMYMAKGFMEIFAHPLKSIEWINDLSPMMKNRTMNVIIDQIMQQSKTYTDSAALRGLYRMQEIGGMGLTLVDRYAVAGGWIGAYYQHMDMLMEQGMDQETASRMAIDWADDITLKTQPTGDATEIAPLFTRGGEWARAFTQFTTALNVIWSNLSYDMPVAMRNAMRSDLPASARMAQFSKVVGTIVGYGLAGAVLGAVAEGYDDDDDEIDKLRKWIYWSFTQATESVPLVGHHVDAVVRSAITGDKPDYFADEFFPGMMKIFKGLGNLAQQDVVKALENLSQGAGYMVGLPVSGFRQLKRSITESPGAMLGR